MNKFGKIIKGIGGFYYILSDDKIYTVKAKKILKHKGLIPTVGDNVCFSYISDNEGGWIESIEERKNILVRPPVSNIDSICIVLSCEPKPDYHLLDTLLIAAFKYSIEPIIIHNKIDISLDEYFADYENINIKIFKVSASKKEGIKELKEYLKNKSICFAGQSGVGKSTLINSLIGSKIQTGDISRIKRGKHTTRHVEIHFIDDICIFDTPGFSAIELFKDVKPDELQKYYPDFIKYADRCRFSPCMHNSEPSCAVKEALKNKEISQNRYDRYLELLREANENWRNRYD